MKQALYFRIALGVICFIYFLFEHLHGRAQMADFRVYYDAANALRNGESVYGVAFGVSSGFYKYSPLAAALFIPFTWFPYTIASGIFYFLITIAVTWFSIASLKLLRKDFPADKLIFSAFITTLFLADHIERELHLGNVNLLLLLSCVAMSHFEKSNKSWASGGLYALILLFKPHFLILAPVLFMFGKYKTLGISLLSLILALLLPALLCGLTQNVELHQLWWNAMKAHNIALHTSPNTIYGILHNAMPLDLPGIVYIILGLTLAATAIFIAWRKSAVLNHELRWNLFFFLAIAAIPNLAHTDTEHFMWSWPLIASLVQSYFHSQRSVLHLLLMLLAFIPYTLNSPDIVGKNLSLLFDEGGLLGLSNLVLLTLGSYYILSTNRNSGEAFRHTE